jgi:hypothetical protein
VDTQIQQNPAIPKNERSWDLVNGTPREQMASILSADSFRAPGVKIELSYQTSYKETWALLFETLCPLSAKKLRSKTVLIFDSS